MQLWELYLLRSIQNGGQFNQRKSSNTSLVSKGEKKKRGNFLLNRFFINAQHTHSCKKAEKTQGE